VAQPGRKRLAQLTTELGGFIAGAPNCCALSWDGSDRPLAGAVGTVLGASADDLFGRPAGQLFTGGERAARDLAALSAQPPAEHHRQMLRNGAQFTAALLLRAGPEGGVVALVRDLAVARAEADAAVRAEDLGRFASLVAHGSLAQNDLRRVAIASREVGNIELLLSEVLEYARPPSLALVPVDPRVPVRESVEGVTDEFAARNVRFQVSLPERMPLVQADPTRIRTAVKILCRRAGLAAEEAGAPLVEVAVRELPSARWELSVLDSARPLAPEQREKAFVPFTPNGARGSGLGLAVVARIAREHGGEARIEERPEGGNAVRGVFSQ
jgi:signal transduction histidine kinase